MASNHHYLYIVRCADGSLFTGVADDLDRAVLEMNAGNAGAYVRARAPVFLAYSEEYMNARDAEARAATVRRMNRAGKERMLSSTGISSLDFGLAA
jgi:putative endonuclease